MTGEPRATSPLILLHPDDNVLICRRMVHAGDSVLIDGQAITVGESVDVGHKLARRSMRPGDLVHKYGVPIGTMTLPASIGAHVHMHNLKSNYLASHTRQSITDREQP